MKKLFTLLSLALLAFGAGAQTLINYPASDAGITVNGTTTVSTVKIHTNADAVPCLKLANGDTTDGTVNGNYILLETEGGFKTGDVVTIAGAINNTDATKRATAVIFTVKDETATEKIFQFDDFINSRLVADDPVKQSYTLEADYDKLYIGRDGGTAANVTLLKVVRGDEEPGTDPGDDPVVVPTGGIKVDIDCTPAPTQEEKDALAATRLSPDGQFSVLFEKVNKFDSSKGISIKDGTEVTVTIPEGGSILHLLFTIGGSSSAENSYWLLDGQEIGKQKPWKETTEEFDLPAGTGNTVKLVFGAGKPESTSAYIKGVTITCTGVTTGIETVERAGRHSTAVYNLAGQRVATPQKGLYLRDGKKYVK